MSNEQTWNKLKEEGIAFFDEGKYEEAIQKFEEALRMQPDAEVRAKLLEAEANLNKYKTDKSKKNLVYLGMFSVFMLFAGFTSAYIVSMGDNFWIKAPLPPAFYISTVIIVVSSITFQLAVVLNKRGEYGCVERVDNADFLIRDRFYLLSI